jgi:hypothetical protein
LTTAPKIKGVSHFEHTHTQKKKHGKALWLEARTRC